MHKPALCIDVSKSSSFANPFISLNSPADKPFSFSHDSHGLKLALNALNTLESTTGIKPDIVLEATGNYSKPLTHTFYSLGYNIVVLNPLVTSLHKRKSIRKVKTDPSDTFRIAKVYYMNDYIYFKPDPNRFANLKSLSRQWHSLNDSYTSLQLKFSSALEVSFPEFNKLFRSTRCKTALQILRTYPCPQAILAADKIELFNILKKSRHSDAWCMTKMDQLFMVSRESLTLKMSQQQLDACIITYIDFLEFYDSKLTDFRAHMIETAQRLPEFTILKSIPGIGDITATTILSEIGDISRFSNHKQLVAYAGIDPSVHQSGNFRSTHNKISKRGTPYLRKALYQATRSSVTNRSKGPLNQNLYEYFQKKLGENKPYNVAIVATSNKLLRIIYALLSTGSLYDNEN